MAVHVVLNEIGAKFELKNVAVPQGQPKPAELLKVNPRGAVPVLEIDGFILREGAAILTYLLETNKNELLPTSGNEKAAALEWLCFANSSLHPLYSRLFFMKKTLGAEMEKNPVYETTIKQIQNYWDEIEARLEKQEYIAGNKITIADILIAVIANWSPVFGSAIKFGEKTKAYFSKIISRPSFKKALETEGVTYKILLPSGR
ncbi:MAG: glutathione S-transferase, N-terminal domain protein [Rickettsiaceae bacterium]|jgi:glutathione S-transferase|nr:glutathione S-transferase, N-terminal domain protein [Rickettsiaceae bacterium]